MAYKFFCDTNVIIDFFSDDRPAHAVALQIFQLVQQHKLQTFISETTITNTAYILWKAASPNVLRQQLSTLLFYFNVLPNNNAICSKALKSNFKDTEDAILYHLTLHHGLDYFITENVRDFTAVSPQLPVLSTAAFLKLV